MKTVTSLFILLFPHAVLMVDCLVWYIGGRDSTITAVVREWAARSPWVEFIFLLAVVVLYLHLFRGWPVSQKP